MKQRHEIVEGIEASLRSTPQVSGAAYFGSLGTGTCDSFSDIDLVVRCKKVARGLQPKHPLLETEKALREFQSRNLRPEIWDLYRTSLEHLRGSA